jgi:aminomethyltransferase
VGISINHDDALVGGESLWLNGEEVGVVNSPAYSQRMEQSLALVHLSPGAALAGTKLEVRSEAFTGTAEVLKTPFYDVNKSRTRA